MIHNGENIPALWMVFILVLCAGGCSSSGSGTSSSGGSTNASSQQRIVFTGASTIARGDWSSYFGISIDNKAVGGIESSVLKDNIEGQVASKPNKVFFSIGTNDILNRHESGLISNISTIIEKIKSASPTTKIYVMSILPVKDTFSSALVERYNDQIESTCHSKNVSFISIYNLFKGSSSTINDTYYLADGIHLTDAGYQVYADAIRSYVLSG